MRERMRLEEEDAPLATVHPRAEQGGDDATAIEGVFGVGEASRRSTRHEGT
jgi:hypothetical protein